MIWEGIAGKFSVCNAVKKGSVGVSTIGEDASACFGPVRLPPTDSKLSRHLRLHTNNKSSLHSYRLVKYRPSKDGLI